MICRCADVGWSMEAEQWCLVRQEELDMIRRKDILGNFSPPMWYLSSLDTDMECEWFTKHGTLSHTVTLLMFHVVENFGSSVTCWKWKLKSCSVLNFSTYRLDQQANWPKLLWPAWWLDVCSSIYCLISVCCRKLGSFKVEYWIVCHAYSKRVHSA